MAIKLRESAYSSHFLELLHTDKRYVIAFGGRGSGKTFHIVLKLLLKSFEDKYNHILYVNKEMSHIRSQQYAFFKMVASQTGLYSYFDWYNGDMRIVNKITGTKFTPVGMNDSERTKGIADASIVWFDEITKGTQEDFTTLNALLRTPKNKHQFIISFNPVSDKHWLRSFFFKEEDAYALKDEFSDSYLNHSTYIHNEFIDRDDYKRNLLLNAGGNEARLQCDLYGYWGVAEIQSPAIRNFEENRHVGKVIRNDKYPIIFAIDFNCEPLIALECQEYHDNGVHKIRVNREIRLEKGSTQDLIKYIQEHYTKEQLVRALFTGDASGRAKTTAAAESNWAQIIRAFNASNRIFLPKANPNVLNSLEICDYVFALHNDLLIDSTAQTLIFELIYTEKDSNGIVKKNRSKDEQKADALDCFRYFIWTFFRLRNDIVRNGRYFGIK